jgi:NitT/TauT family transport system ATP-binding protein
VLEVDLPYPRSHLLVTSTRYRELVQAASSAVHEEALRAFELGEREG